MQRINKIPHVLREWIIGEKRKSLIVWVCVNATGEEKTDLIEERGNYPTYLSERVKGTHFSLNHCNSQGV